jgi:transposase
MTVRATTLVRKLIGIVGLWVTGLEVEDGALVARVRPNWHDPRCSGCGKRPPRQRSGGAKVARPGRKWRHLDLAGIRLFLAYDARWVYCPDCGRRVEQVPWASDPAARYTSDFDQHVAFLAQRSDQTSVQKLMRITWESVGRCIQRVVKRLRPEQSLAGLTAIGVDELSYRKQHHYVTLVTDQLERRIVWGKEGKSAKTLETFFEELGEEGRRRLQLVSMDMSGGYQKAVHDNPELSHVQIVFDRFHVQQLASTALDETRREEWNRLRREHGKYSAEAKTFKGLRWTLLQDGLTLSEAQQTRLSELQRDNKRLYRAYLLKEELGDILDRRQPNVVRELLEKWCSWASRSRLPAFVRTAQTIREHLEGIVAYVRHRISNGLVEGLNTKARLITRRAYGFHSAEAVLAMIDLCCSGLDVRPAHKQLGE